MNLETLNNILEKIDDMKQDLPEGLYLHLMNDLKKRYDQLKDDKSNGAIYIIFTFKDVIITLIEATAWFLKQSLSLKETWDEEKEDFVGENDPLTSSRRFINCKFTIVMHNHHPHILDVMCHQKFFEDYWEDDLLNLKEIVFLLLELSTNKAMVEYIPELRKYNFRKLYNAFCNKFFNIKFDIIGLKKAGYIMGHVNAKNYKKMHKRNMLNNRK